MAPEAGAPTPKLTTSEILTDLPAAIKLFEAIQARVNTLPPKAERNAEAYVRAFAGATEGSPLLLAAQLFDQIEKQAAD